MHYLATALQQRAHIRDKSGKSSGEFFGKDHRIMFKTRRAVLLTRIELWGTPQKICVGLVMMLLTLTTQLKSVENYALILVDGPRFRMPQAYTLMGHGYPCQRLP